MIDLIAVVGCAGYFITDTGEIWTQWAERKPYDGTSPLVRLPHLRKMRLRVHSNGYLTITIRKRWFVHRLVLEAFVGPCPEYMECRHIDGDKTNNHTSNLVWGTHLENMEDIKRYGGTVGGPRLGEVNGSAKLTAEKVREIRRMKAKGYGSTKLSRLYGVSTYAIKCVLNGRTWGHVK